MCQSLHRLLIMTADWMYHCKEIGSACVAFSISSLHLLLSFLSAVLHLFHLNHLVFHIVSEINNQIIQKGFFFTYNLVDIMNIITFIIFYTNLLENLIYYWICILIYNLLVYFNV